MSELKQEEIEKISGGVFTERNSINIHGALINPKEYAIHLNENVVAISKINKDAYVKGKLIWVGEVSKGCSTTISYKIYVITRSNSARYINDKEITIGEECSFLENQMNLYEAAESIIFM